MCLALYLIADRELPSGTFKPRKRAFYVEKLQDGYGYTAELKALYPERLIYYLGSHEGCSCGFRGLTYSDPYRMSKDERLVLQTRIKLYHFLTRNNLLPATIYCCWDGDQGGRPRQTIVIKLEEILDFCFDFEELVEYLITA